MEDEYENNEPTSGGDTYGAAPGSMIIGQDFLEGGGNIDLPTIEDISEAENQKPKII